jgi:prophage regulatory protein
MTATPRHTANVDAIVGRRRMAERTLEAAQLLQEALVLLGAHQQWSNAPVPQRSNDRLLRLPEVQLLTGLRRTAIYEQMRRGLFPRSVRTGSRAMCWSEAAVQRWIADRIAGQPLQASPGSIKLDHGPKP